MRLLVSTTDASGKDIILIDSNEGRGVSDGDLMCINGMVYVVAKTFCIYDPAGDEWTNHVLVAKLPNSWAKAIARSLPKYDKHEGESEQ